MVVEVSYSHWLPTSLFFEKISSAHFGTSFENRGQSISEGSPFTEVVESLPVAFLRYPGGSQTESFFDPSAPDSTQHHSIFNNASVADFEPISKFIGYVSANTIQPIFVIPTFRYFQKDAAGSYYLTASAETEIASFVRDLLSGKFGYVEIAAFEIGNEWFNSRMLFNEAQNPHGWTPQEFGIIQGRIVEIVNSVISEFAMTNEPEIWVQSGQNGDKDLDDNGVRDNIEILAGLSGDAIGFVDGVVDHFYQPTRSDTVLEVISTGWVSSGRIDRLIEDGWDVEEGGSLDIVTTEWNIRAARNGDQSGDDANITGFERLPLVLGLFADMIQEGVDWALMYTAQGLGLNGGSGTLSRYGENTLTPTGLLFQLMGNALPGTQLVDPNGDGQLTSKDFLLTDTAGGGVGVTYTFVGEGNLVVYFASAVDFETSFSVSGFLSYIDSGFQVSATLLRVSEGENALDADATGQILSIPVSSLVENITEDGLLDFVLGSHEILQLEVTSIDDQYSFLGHPSVCPNDIRGSAASDLIFGTEGSDLLFGLGGDDSLEGGAGDDTVIGGLGSDMVGLGDGDDVFYDSSESGANGADWIDAGSGNDTVWGNSGNDTVYGGEGRDLIFGGRGINWIVGGAGDDTISAGDGSDTVWGGTGADLINGGLGKDWIDGGGQNDTIHAGAGDDVVSGGFGADTVYLGDGNDVFNDNTQSGIYGQDWIDAGEGRDTVNADGGNDTILGGGGEDLIFGGAGDDEIDGGGQYDTIHGGNGNDIVRGGLGSDHIYLNAGNDIFHDEPQADANGRDWVEGGNGDDTLYGGGGNDTLYGGAGNDWIDGGSQYDTIHGGAGHDTVHGGGGADLAYLNDGNDVFHDNGQGGIHGRDKVYAGPGDDTIHAGGGDDIFFGEAGADTFIFKPGAGSDVIMDFVPGVDVIVFDVPGMTYEDLSITGSGADTVIDFGADQILLTDVDFSVLTSDHFNFL